MTSSRCGWGAIGPAATIALGISVCAASGTIDDTALLKEIGFSTQEVQRIDHGELVARSIDSDGSAIALAVAATIAIPPVYYLEKFRDIESFKKTHEVLKVGRFAREPTADDVAGLTLDEEDIEDLRSCRVGDCGLKLDAQGIQAIARRDTRIDQASAGLRQYLAAYTHRYLRSGNAALMQYDDSAPPGRVVDQLHTISERSGYLRRWPAVFDGVFHFNGVLPAGLEDFAYWSKEKVGPRAVVSVTHVLISPPRDGTAVVATKQIYVSHYGIASLGTTILLDKGTPETPRMRIVYVNRSRVDVFGGILGPIKRPLVRSRARDSAERMMRGLKERLEGQYKAAAGLKP